MKNYIIRYSEKIENPLRKGTLYKLADLPKVMQELNKIVDDRKIPMSKLKDYEPDPFNNASPAFNYGLFIDYSKECIPGKGAGIFMHCTGAYDYTSGCVSVSEDDMKFILQNVDNNVRICIFPRDWN